MPADLKVLFLAAEAEPLIKVGGLGDVAGSLPPALMELGGLAAGYKSLDVRLALPFHPQMKGRLEPLRKVADVRVPSTYGDILGEVYLLEGSEIPVYLVDGSPVRASPQVYSGDDSVDGRKYVFFSQAVINFLAEIRWMPDILHANDWHTAPAVYRVALDRDEGTASGAIRTLLTIHNLPYTGGGAGTAMEEFGLPPISHSDLPSWAAQLPLPLGILTSDRIVAVSPGYAREIQTPEFGAGLDGLLRSRQDVISGIINGIDPSIWDPADDPQLRMPYSIASLPARLRNKSALQREVGLPLEKGTPLVSMVTRMVHQKGVDLAIDAFQMLADLEWQALLLGTGDPSLEQAALDLQDRFPKRVYAAIRYNPNFSRRVYAGSDLILIPSRYEPCGLTQMIGMRYGCVPLARSTGGLADTIRDYPTSKEGTGFLFPQDRAEILASTIRTALAVYPDKRKWQGIQRRGMKEDFSWGRSARQYLALYKDMLAG
jgi:starch synthase